MAETVPTLRNNESTTDQPDVLVVPLGFFAQTWWLLRRAFMAAYEDNCFSIAKGAAYSSLLSLFPILTTMTAILFQLNAEPVVQVIARFVRQIVPPGTEDLVLSRLRERGAKPISLSAIAIGVSLWAGSGAMITLMEGFQAAYRIPSGRPFVKQRAMAIFLVLIAAFPSVAASSLILFGNRTELWLVHSLGGGAELSTPVELAWKVGRYALAFATTTFVTGLLYYFGPNHRPEPERIRKSAGSRFRRVWPGALLSTILWTLATAGFAAYVAHAHYNAFYGSLATVIVLSIWLYLTNCIALLGCEFNAERERAESMPSLS